MLSLLQCMYFYVLLYRVFFFVTQSTLVVRMLSVLSRDPCRSRIRLRCNGWTKGDVLKIFVRPGGGGRVSCCDLAIGLAGKARLSEGSPPYGLLWADPARADEGLEGAGSWREEDVSRWQ